MSAKVKLISFISAFVLVLGIMIIGVLSAEQVQVNIGGSVSFNATNVYAKVSGNISGAETGNKTFSTLTYSASETTGDESDWTNLALVFTEIPDPIIITIRVENLSTQRKLTANLTNSLSASGLNIAVTRDSGAYTFGTNFELPVSTGDGSSTTTFTLTLTVADPNQDLTGVNFGYILNLYDENYAPDQPYQRVDAEGNPDENGNYLLFGWYPQTVKANDVTIVNETQPEANGYYLGSDGVYYMRATAAVNSDGEKYPNFKDGTSITQGTEYYFKMEQLKWRILTEDYNGTGNALIVCDTIVDMRPYQSNYVYQNDCYYATDDDGTILIDNEATVGQGVDSNHQVYANNYEHSEIREYLNNTFYNTAFSDEEKSYIVTTTVDNSLESVFGSYATELGYTEDNFNYECRDTQDNVFLLSLSDVNNTTYGFRDTYEATIIDSDITQAIDSARYYYTSDYSKAMGAGTITQEMFDAQFGGMEELFGEGIIGSGAGWLRSPYVNNFGRLAFIVYYGTYDYGYVDDDSDGVVPALQIKL